MKIKMLIFDLDGTLIDTLQDLACSVNFVLNKHGFKERDLSEIREFVGNGVKKLIERSLPKNSSQDIIELSFKEMVAHYQIHAMDKTAPYDGIKDLIISLKKQGLKLAVVTNKIQVAAEEIINDFFEDYFDIIVGDNKSIPLKPSPDGIELILKKFNLTKEEVLYIGDTEVDYQTAINAGVESIMVLWGFREKALLEKMGAKTFAKNCIDLEKLIKERL